MTLLQELIERCRRQQQQLPQFQPEPEWASEEEALEHWRSDIASGQLGPTRILLPPYA